MNKFNPWAFAILFILFFIFISFNETNWSLYFTKDNKETKAYVYRTKIGYGTGGKGYMQFVHYTFEADGKIYKSWKKIGKKYSWQYIGNTLTVIYSIGDPSDNQVIEFNNEFNNDKERAFISLKKEGGYSQIELINGIYFFKDYIENDIIQEEGTYTEKLDTLTLKPFFKSTLKKFVFNQEKEFLDIETGIIYK